MTPSSVTGPSNGSFRLVSKFLDLGEVGFSLGLFALVFVGEAPPIVGSAKFWVEADRFGAVGDGVAVLALFGVVYTPVVCIDCLLFF